MKRVGLLVTVVFAGTVFCVWGEMRTWTSVKGPTIDAAFVREAGGLVYLKTEEGAEKTIRLSMLSKEDQQLVAKLSSPFVKRSDEAAPVKASEGLYELFGSDLRNAKDKKVSVDTLAGKTVAIYFSAHWCPPCRAFSPILVDFYNEAQKAGKPLEIVFVSSDRSEREMYDYMKGAKMPWLAVEFGDDYIGQLKTRFGIKGIPALIVVDSEGKLVTKDGRGDVKKLGVRAFNVWSKSE
jgi:thiol-disulfide isomerase/thioredoxin